jgi:hypothetical protein
MTSYSLGVLIVVAAAQVPGSTPAPPEDAIPAHAIPSNAALPDTAIGKQPFQKLFTQPKDAESQADHVRKMLEAQQQAAEKTAPRIVCGMVVIPADPRIDPKMIHRPLPNPPTNEPTTTFHIKRIPPGICNE